MIKNHGLIIPPIIEGDHYVLGGYSGIVNRPILMPTGHGWSAFKPVAELQNKNGFESMNCSNYGTCNCYETLAAFKGYEDFPKNCAERYTGVHTGTTPQGNDPHHVPEVIRTYCGVIPEVDMPFDDTIRTWEGYYDRFAAGLLVPLGRAILKRFKFGHEWVINSPVWFGGKPALLTNALKYGPVAVSVYAWNLHNGLYAKSDTDQDNHWVQLLDFVDGKYWIVYDHYDSVIKQLEWHYNFFAAKVYYLDRITSNEKASFWDMIVDMFVRSGLFKGKTS